MDYSVNNRLADTLFRQMLDAGKETFYTTFSDNKLGKKSLKTSIKKIRSSRNAKAGDFLSSLSRLYILSDAEIKYMLENCFYSPHGDRTSTPIELNKILSSNVKIDIRRYIIRSKEDLIRTYADAFFDNNEDFIRENRWFMMVMSLPNKDIEMFSRKNFRYEPTTLEIMESTCQTYQTLK